MITNNIENEQGWIINPNERKALDNALTREEQKLFLSCVDKENKEELMSADLSKQGLRIGEFYEMSKTWLDWDRGEIRIPKEHLGWKPKTAAGARIIPIVDDQLKANLMWFFTRYNRIGDQMSKPTIWRAVKRIAKKTRKTLQEQERDLMKNIYPHALRATAALRFCDWGLPPAQLCSIFGWSNIKVAKYYIKFSGVEVRDEVKALKQKRAFL